MYNYFNMYDLPVIPIIVFLLLFLPSLMIGFFRGWKASLHIALITFALVGVVVGISFAIYDQLWNMFESFYLGDLNSNIDHENWKVISRPSIITLFVGLCLIPIYGLTMLLYFPVKKLLIRYLWPKTKDISPNEKSVHWNKHLVSRFSGVAISGTSALFFASASASSASNLFVNGSESQFTSFSSKMTEIYTFGNGKHNFALKSLSSFANKHLTTENQKKLLSLILLGLQNSKNTFTIDPHYGDLIKEMSHGKIYDGIYSFRNSPIIIETIVKIVACKSQPIVLMDNDYQQVDDHGKPIGKKHQPIAGLQNALDNLKNNYHGVKYQLSDNSLDAFISVVEDKIIAEYNTTGYFQQFSDASNFQDVLKVKIETLTKKLKEKENTYNSLLTELSDAYSTLNQDKQTLETFGLSTTLSPTRENSYQYVSKGDATVSTRTILSNGSIKLQEQNWKTANDKKIHAKSEQDKTDIIFVGSPGATIGFGGISLTHKRKEEEVKTLEASMNQAKAEWDKILADDSATADQKSQKEQAYKDAKRDFDAKATELSNYEKSTYQAAKENYEKNQAAYKQAESNEKSEMQKLQSLNNQKGDIIKRMSETVLKRNEIISKIYSTSDEINTLNGRNKEIGRDEIHHEGTLMPKPQFNPLAIQTQQYIDWAYSSIVGATDYFENFQKDVEVYKQKSLAKQKEYNVLKENYLNVLRKILS